LGKPDEFGRFNFTSNLLLMNRLLRLCLLFSGLFAAVSSYSQTLYEMRYSYTSDGVTDRLSAFILRNDDGTGLVRVAYLNSEDNKNKLVEMEMQESYGQHEDGTEDSSQLVFVGLNPRFIIGTPDDEFLEDHFVFSFNPDSGFYEPSFVFSMPDDTSTQVGQLEEVRFLNQEDLTQELVLQFFTEQDVFYKQLFETSTRGLSADDKQAQLHLVLVANTEDKDIGKTCVIDKDATYKTFSEIAEFLEINFKPTVIAGKEFSKVNVDKAVSSVRPGPNDIVVFYYSGHGFNEVDEQYQFPYLDLRDKSFQKYGGAYTMNVEAIYQKLRAKGARLNLVISDCCNKDPTSGALVSSEGASTRTSSIGWNKENCQALFMSKQPMSIMMTAAQKGELSAGNQFAFLCSRQKGELSAGNPSDGGIFTFIFREQLEKALGPFTRNPSWNNLVQSAKKETVNKARTTWCNKEKRIVCVQNPVFKME